MADDAMEELRQVYSALDTRDLLDELRNRGLRADGVRCAVRVFMCVSICVCVCVWLSLLERATPPTISHTLGSSSTHARTHTKAVEKGDLVEQLVRHDQGLPPLVRVCVGR